VNNAFQKSFKENIHRADAIAFWIAATVNAAR
jgi:hypothetical protein